MYPEKEHFRHCMLYELNSGKNASAATRSIYLVYGEGALDVRTCQKWFAKFKVEEFNLSDQERPGRPVEANDTLLEELIQEGPRRLSTELFL